MGTLGMLSGTKVLEGMSLSEAYKKVKTLKSPSWQDSPSAYHRRSREPHACNLSDGLAIAAKKLSSDVQGLELREMRP
ncbi:hypothetical protein BU24DRAFT_421257 [Aaosphaeria arxii CBS 175.79]|uniref:Uncharacterized protein n=1 Tax=Aaosphaeria arxii CBS 175.79 TaxID=1450172 RepID=A0A6A5XZX5_9PLEO|nr:uncharacterized protein BU24DRAFT_421257 [Aaosphaeria arxii CBS 175.79]KAF2018261.1 hypothetical protein BU24DRAFT_421257 [Aaosphaeria arxii CBS 175.79]